MVAYVLWDCSTTILGKLSDSATQKLHFLEQLIHRLARDYSSRVRSIPNLRHEYENLTGRFFPRAQDVMVGCENDFPTAVTGTIFLQPRLNQRPWDNRINQTSQIEHRNIRGARDGTKVVLHNQIKTMRSREQIDWCAVLDKLLKVRADFRRITFARAGVNRVKSQNRFQQRMRNMAHEKISELHRRNDRMTHKAARENDSLNFKMF